MLPWTEAKSDCEAMGSKLAVVTSKNEQNALRPYVTTATWIGLQRIFRGTSLRWQWIDNSNFNYTNWFIFAQPNNSSNLEVCAVTEPIYNSWYSRNCSDQQHYVCEKSGR